MSGRRTGLALALLLAASFALRLAHGAHQPDGGRYYDELFSFRNVEAVFSGSGLKPSNAYYPTLSYLPQTVVLAASGALSSALGLPGLAVRGETADGWSPAAYRICRGVTALFGTLSLWAVYRLGRRLADRRVGLVAACFLALLPPHLMASAIFKPDVLVLWLTLETFLWSLDAVEKSDRRRFVLVGIGVGMTVSAKYTGVGAALPLVAGTLLAGGWREPARWRRLLLAGAVSVATFVVLNPFLFVALRYIPRLMEIAKGKAEALESTPWTVAQRELAFLWHQHGPAVFAIAIAGLLWLSWRLWAKATPSAERRPVAMLLAYVGGFSALYAAAGGVFRGQNYLAVGALTGLAGAWWLVAVGDRLRALAPRLPAALAPAAGVALVATAIGLPARATYLEIVPQTMERAERLLAGRLDDLARRRVYFERRDVPMWPKAKGNRMEALPVAGLGDVAREELDLADAEVFFADRLDGAGADFYLGRLRRSGVEPVRIAPGLWTARGPALVVLLHPWTARGEPMALAVAPAAGTGEWRLGLPAAQVQDDRVSLELRLPAARGRPRPDRVGVGELDLPLHETGFQGRRAWFTTRRFPLPAEAIEAGLRLPADLALVEPPEVHLQRWAPPGGGAGG